MTQSNGNKVQDGQSQNGFSKDTLLLNANTPPQEEKNEPVSLDTSKFEKNVVLRQSRVWTHWMTWTIMGVTAFAVGWSAIAKIEQVVPAQGQLKPKGTVKEIQAPINGVVKSVTVKDGDTIKKGEPLLVFDSEATSAELQSLQKIRESYIQENKFYRTLINSNLNAFLVQQAIAQLKLPVEVQALALNRAALVEENNLFSIQIKQGGNTLYLKPEEIARISVANAELKSRAMAAQLKIQQLEKLYITQAEEGLRIEKEILQSIQPLAEEGAVAKIQVDLQQQKVRDREKELVQQKANGIIEYENQQQQVVTRLAEIQQIEEEQKRFTLSMNQGNEELKTVLASAEREIRDRMAENGKRIAEIDSQINKIVVDNEKKIAETNSQIRAAEQTIKYQEVKAPVSGTVFDLKAGPGYVPKSGQAEALLKIVPEGGPDNPLIAEVYVTNEDIGFVRKGQRTDVRIDSFSYSEFGDIKGTVNIIGSDALPPDEIYKFYRFPVKVELDKQTLTVRGKETPLQSGMSVTVNIKVKENRTVLSLFTETFRKKVDTLQDVR
jgi:HlyD family secretion protein